MSAKKKAVGLVLVLVHGLSFVPSERADEAFQKYVNEKHRCSLFYAPRTWRLQVQSGSGSEVAIFTARDAPEVMAVLNMFDPVPGLTLHPRQLFDMDKGALATIFGGLDIEEERVLTLSGAMAHRVTFSGREKRVTRYTVVHQGFVYLLVYIAPKAQYAAYLPAFRLMVETFRIFGTGVPDADPAALPLDVSAEPAGDRALRLRTEPDPVFVEVREGDENWHYHLVLANPHERDVELREVRVRFLKGERVLEETKLDPPALEQMFGKSMSRIPPRGEVTWRNQAGHRAEGAPESIEYTFFFGEGERVFRQVFRVRLLRYEQKTRFTLPFRGVWRVLHGHDIFEGHRQRADAQAFAYDFVSERLGRDRRERSGRSAGRVPARRTARRSSRDHLTDFYAFGQEVLAPADGVVVRAVDGEPDWPPASTRLLFAHPAVTSPRQLFGNYVVLDHGHGEFSLLAHLKRGSLRVRRGDRVKRGQVIAQCGNSGLSAQPHLHFQVMDGPDPLRSRGLPIRFESYRCWWAGRVSNVRQGVPVTGERVEPVRLIQPRSRKPPSVRRVPRRQRVRRLADLRKDLRARQSVGTIWPGSIA